MKLRYLFIFYIVFFTTSTIFSQYYFQGEIRDKETEEVLAFASINYNGKQTVSDNSGIFKLKTLSDTLILTIDYMGYSSFSMKKVIDTKFNDLKTIYLNPIFNSLKEVTITSGKYEKLISDVTVSMEAISPKFIENNNTTRFDDLLEKIPGVNYVDGQANIRGGSGFSYGAGSRVLVLINNMPALQFDSAIPNWENIPVETIAKVEVMKGAGSSLYGSAAMNGIINILPIYAKKKTLLKFKLFHTIYDAPADLEKKWWSKSPYKIGGSAVFAKKINKLDIVSSLYYQKTDSYKEHCFSNSGRGTLKLDYHFNDELTIGINSNYNTNKELTFFYWKNSNKNAYQADTVAYSAKDKKLLIVDPYISFQNKKWGKHKLQSRIYTVSNLIKIDKYDISTSYYGEYQFQKDFDKIDLILTAGIVKTHSTTNAELYGDTIFVAKNTGIYLQTEKKLWNRLNLIAGARYEINSIIGPQILNGIDISDKYSSEKTPIFRVGANFKLFPLTNLRVSWGEGFRYPTIAEKFTNAFEGSLVFAPNPDLKSETGYTTEIGVRQGFKFLQFKGFFDVSAFQSEYDNMIEFELKFDQILYFTSANLGNTIVKGLELSSGFSGQIGKVKLNFIGGYYYIDPKYKNFNEEIKRNLSVDYNILKYRNKESFKFDTEIEYKEITFGIGSTYSSFMEAIDKIFEQEVFIKGVKEYREKHMEGNNIYRMRIGYRYKQLGFIINIDNLFNKEYSVRPGLMEAPRSFTFSLNYEL